MAHFVEPCSYQRLCPDPTNIDLRVSFDCYGTQMLGVAADVRCYSVGTIFHAYDLGSSMTFPSPAKAPRWSSRPGRLHPDRPPLGARGGSGR
jgi:hypothetical protein